MKKFLSEDSVVIEFIKPVVKTIATTATPVVTASSAIDMLNHIQKDIAVLLKSNATVAGTGTMATTVAITHCDTSNGTFVAIPDLAFKSTVSAMAKTASQIYFGLKSDQLKRYVIITVTIDGVAADTSVISADIIASI